MKLTYDPAVFRTPDLESARQIILTKEGGQDTDTRWERETPYLAGLIAEQIDLRAGQVVLDYGCGVGRLAKALIERFDCFVVGADISQDMRGLAPGYVNSAAFSVLSRRVLQRLAEGGLRVDAAFSAWVLQHCHQPAEDIQLIRGALKPGGPLFIANTFGRAVPTAEQRWASDGIDVRAELSATFREDAFGRLAEESVGTTISSVTFWGVYR